MPVVNPGIRRYIGSAIQRLFNSASFSAPLTHSLTLERGTGSPTFTRATTATFQDFEGKLRYVPAGCARFTGARMVYNRVVTTSEDFSNAAWTKGAGVTLSKTVANPLDGAATATLVTVVGATTGTHETGLTNEAGTYLVSEYFKKGSGRYPCIQVHSNGSASADYITLDMDAVPVTAVSQHAGSAVQSVDNITVTELPDGWVRVSARVITSANLNLFGSALMTSQAVIGYATGTYNQYGPLLENITGRTDQTTPSEYVSVGVLSAPYHGAGVDGVEFFDTDLDGNALTTLKGYLAEPAATNLRLQSNSLTTTPWADQVGTCAPTQNAIGPDGATSAWTLTDNDAGATETYGANISALTAATYTTSIFVSKTSGAQSSYPVVLMYDGTALRLAAATIDTTNGVATVWTSYTGWTAVGTAACESYNDDFWRVSLTLTASTNVWVINLIPAGALTATLAGPAFDASAQGSAVFYGAQVELGSSATSYIPTTTVAVARNADVLTYPSAGNVSGTVGWCSADVRVDANGTNFDKYAVIGTTGNGPMRFVNSGLYMYDGTANRIFSGVTEDGSLQKLAVTWGGTSSNGAINGVLPGAQGFDGNLDMGAAIGIGVYVPTGGNHLNGNIKNVRIGQRQLSASELQAVTKT